MAIFDTLNTIPEFPHLSKKKKKTLFSVFLVTQAYTLWNYDTKNHTENLE